MTQTKPRQWNWRAAALATAILAGGCTAPAVEEGCNRDCLVSIADIYVAAMVAGEPAVAPLAADIKIVENLMPVATDEGLWQSAVGRSSSYRIYVPDPELNTVGMMTVIQRQADAQTVPALLAIRLTLAEGKVIEAEHLVADVTTEVDPSRLQTPRPNITAAVPESRRLAHSELAGIAESYYEALDRSDGTLAPFADDCERQENGMITAAYYLEPESFDAIDRNGQSPPAVARDCIGQMNSRRFAYIDSIDNRRIVAVDPVQGLAMGFSHFRQSMDNGPHLMIAADGTEHMWDEQREPYDLPAAHIFKITEGEIHEVEAIGVFVAYKAATGWE